MTPGEARGYLARFLFRGDDVFKEVRSLSGGERSRLELALLGIMPSNLLLLDEPTNHLDIPAREAIESFLRETPATLLVVTHDRRLLETICTSCGSSTTGSPRRSTAATARGERRWPRLDGGRGGGASAGGTGRGRRVGGGRVDRGAGGGRGPSSPPEAGVRAATARPARRERLSKDAYRRQQEIVDAELTRLGLRKNHLELAMGDPAVPRTSSSCGGSRASWPTSTRRWRSPRMPGWSSRSARRDDAGSASPGRSAAASRPSPAGSRSSARSRSTPTRSLAR